MENRQVSMLDVLIETHTGLERQGPGSPEMTLRALSFIDSLANNPTILDLGCGTGGQTMTLALNTSARVIGVDQFPEFISVFSDRVSNLNLQDRVSGIVGDIKSMDNLSLAKGEIDVIWCEGVLDGNGFEDVLKHWNGFLRKSGYVALTCPAWLGCERPTEVEKFWKEEGCSLNSVHDNIAIMQMCGYSFVAAFALPEKCWTENYFTPRTVAEKAFSEKHIGNKIVEDYLKNSKRETELYSQFGQHYGYVFYIVKKTGGCENEAKISSFTVGRGFQQF